MSDDAPIFHPDAFRLSVQEIELTERVRELGSEKFSARAAGYDAAAEFPTANYADLRESGLLGICIPTIYGGLGASYRVYALCAAEMGRYCGATALTWNMHVCSCLWTGELSDSLKLTVEERTLHEKLRARHYARIISDGSIYAQPFSEIRDNALDTEPFMTTAVREDGNWRITGRKIFASLSGHADYYGILCTAVADKSDERSQRNTLYIAVPNNALGVSVVGDWDPLGMRGTVSRTLLLDEVIVPVEEALMPMGFYYQAALRWPHMFLTLTPTYVGIAQAAMDFTVKYLRGEVPGYEDKRYRQSGAKSSNVARMQIQLEQTKALWFQVISEAQVDPSREQVLRAYAAHYTVMENANELCQLAIRTCGGRSILKNLPLERFYRDSRCGSLMLPWTADSCVDRIGSALLTRSENQD